MAISGFAVFALKLISICATLLCQVGGERTSQKIYSPLEAEYHCFRRLNATHQIGCASDRGGNNGVVHYVATVDDLDWLMENGPHAPYVVVIEPTFMNLKNFTAFKNSRKISGVIIVHPSNSSAPNPGFSPAEECPNINYGMYHSGSSPGSMDGCQVKWNSFGEGLMFHDWPFPVFLIQNSSHIQMLRDDCFEKFNAPKNGQPRSWPLCSVELRSGMLAAKDTITCIRRSNMETNLSPMRFCDPLGDSNIWSSLFPLNKSVPLANRSLIFVTARLDSFSMFENLAPGADSAVTGLVTLLATAEILSKMKTNIIPPENRNVIFAIFNGEAFDYIGSSRMVYDMENGLFPSKLDDNIISQPSQIQLHHISHFIELNQIGLIGASGFFWVHTDPISTHSSSVNKTVTDIFKKLQLQDKTVFQLAPSDQQLPPASLQRFLLKDPNIPGVVITDHESHFSNKYYNSMFDSGKDQNEWSFSSSARLEDVISSLTSALAGTIVNLLTGNNMDLQPDQTRIHELLDCYLNSINCTLFRETVNPDQRERLRDLPPNLYIGVDNNPSQIRQLTANIMSYLTGEELVNVTNEECHPSSNDNIFTYMWMASSGPDGKGVCIKSTVNLSKAVSPAFIPGYDYDSKLYSTWTESQWDKISARIYLKPSRKQEGLTLGIGLFVVLISFLIVWFLNRNSDVLFTMNTAADC